MKRILKACGKVLLIVGMNVLVPSAWAVTANPGGVNLAAGFGAAIVQAGGGSPGHQRRHHTRHHRATKTRTASNSQGAASVNKPTGNRPNANRQNPNRNRRAG